jgi:hypothetical protein
MHWEYLRPELWRKDCDGYTLERRTLGIGERNGVWYVREHRIVTDDGGTVMDLGRTEWADWSRSGELLFTRGSAVCRIPRGPRGSLREVEQLIDLGPLRFEQVPPTPGALRWDGSRIFGRKIK